LFIVELQENRPVKGHTPNEVRYTLAWLGDYQSILANSDLTVKNKEKMSHLA